MRKRRVSARPPHCHMWIVRASLAHPLKVMAVHRLWMLLSFLECRAILGLGGPYLPRTFTFLNGDSRMKSIRLPRRLCYLTFLLRTGFLRTPLQRPAVLTQICLVKTKSKHCYPLPLCALWLTYHPLTWNTSYRPWHITARQ